ncbi:MAG: FliI/YscN family ATPase [Nitrospinales bacterium]
METINLNKYRSFITNTSPVRKKGEVTRVTGIIIEGNGPAAPVGSICHIYSNDNQSRMEAQIVGFREKRILLMPLEGPFRIEPGSLIEIRDELSTFNISPNILGRVLDGNGKPIDNIGGLSVGIDYPINGTHLNPFDRVRVSQSFDTGVRAINGLATCGKGQRMGILGGKGVGKSTLLGMIARNSEAEVNIIAIIGGRGREVKDLVENCLGSEGLKKSVVIAASADSPALVLLRCAQIATTIAEYFRDQGKDVNLMMDSITRLAQAQKEIGLSVGEPPATRGFPPSVFSLISKLIERAGTSNNEGTITGFYTAFIEENDLNEPISDAMFGVLDGHVHLSREMANQNIYPAIHPLKSVSRLMSDIVSDDHMKLSNQLNSIYSTYNEAEELIKIGAYSKGSNSKIDHAIDKYDSIIDYIRQGTKEFFSIYDSIQGMKIISGV